MKPTIEQILHAVSQSSGISETELKGRLKTKTIANARGVFYCLCSEFNIPPCVTSKFMRRRHSGIIYTSYKYSNYIHTNKQARELYCAVRSHLN